MGKRTGRIRSFPEYAFASSALGPPCRSLGDFVWPIAFHIALTFVKGCFQAYNRTVGHEMGLQGKNPASGVWVGA